MVCTAVSVIQKAKSVNIPGIGYEDVFKTRVKAHKNRIHIENIETI